jgi:hypothetical protein
MVDVHVRAGIQPADMAVVLPSHFIGGTTVLAEDGEDLAVAPSLALAVAADHEPITWARLQI